MKCIHCGREIDNDSVQCRYCGGAISDTDRIKITYEDEIEDFVEPPVIVESHTFIADEDFAKKVSEQIHKNVVVKNGKEVVVDDYDLEGEDEKKFPVVGICIAILLVIIGAIFAFAILPNIMVSQNKKPSTTSIDNTFTSEDWFSKEFMIDGVLYKMNQDYSSFANQGWSYSLEDEQKVEAGARTENDIQLTSSSYKNNHLVIGFYNSSTRATSVKDCKVYSIEVDNSNTDKPIDFELPGGIKTGSGELEITSLHGKLEDDSITVDDVGKFKIYHYTNDLLSLDLTIYDNGGLKKFQYMVD